MTRGNGVYPPSVNAGHPRIESFPDTWERHTFRDLLVDAMRPITLAPETEYQLIVAKRNRHGIAPREVLPGHKIKTPSQFRLEAGDFVIAKRQIAHGACGFVPQALDAAIVSSEYDVFRINESLVLPDFFALCTHTPYFQQTCFHSSIGVTVEKLIFKTERWLRYQLPLPPIEVQRRVVGVTARIDQVITNICSLVDALRRKRAGLLRVLFACDQASPGSAGSWRPFRLRDLVSVNEAGDWGTAPLPKDPWVVVRAGDIRDDGVLALDEAVRRCVCREKRARLALRKGDIVLERSGGSNGRPVGRVAYVCRDADASVTNFLQRLRANEELVLPEFLFYRLMYLHQTGRTNTLQTQTTGIRNLMFERYMEEILFIPKQDEQSRILACLKSCDETIRALESIAEKYRWQKQAVIQIVFSGKLDLARRSIASAEVADA